MKQIILWALLFYSLSINASKIISGPVPYHFTHEMLSFGLLVENTDSIKVILIDPQSHEKLTQKAFTSNFPSYKGYTPVNFIFENLKADYNYTLEIQLNAKKPKSLKQNLRTAPLPDQQDFSFMIGSCAYTPPKSMKWMHPGIEERIYPHMADMKSDFMLWTGDYLYYFKKHFKSFEGMMRRHVFKRKNDKLTEFLMSRPQYAVWDDHDYGPNNSDKDFPLKNDALELWKLFWNNPAYGLDSVPGCFFDFSYQDADFFMLDNRFYRSEESDTGKMLGNGQLKWLKQKLLNSKASFKFIMVGSQMFNTITKDECFCHHKQEWEELLEFINDHKIEGIIWLSGDRHHTNLFKVEDIAAYPYYEYTCSAITTFRSKLKRSNEYINPIRVEGTLVQKQNFGMVYISGPADNRKCLIETYDNRGELIWDYTIEANELR